MHVTSIRNLGSVLKMSADDMHNFFSSQQFGKDVALILGANGITACKAGELKNIFRVIKGTRKTAALKGIEMFQTQIGAWPEGREKAAMSAWLDNARTHPGYIKATEFVETLKAATKLEQKEIDRRNRLMDAVAEAKKALKKAATTLDSSSDVLAPLPRNQFAKDARDATNALIAALERKVTLVNRLEKKKPPESSDHSKELRGVLVEHITALRQQLADAMATNAPDKAISFAGVWTCMEAAEQALANMKGYPPHVVPTSTEALPPVLGKATTFQLDLQKRMVALLEKHQADGSEVQISKRVLSGLMQDVVQLKILGVTKSQPEVKEAGAMLQVAKQMMTTLSGTTLPTYADLHAWAKQIATMPGHDAGIVPAAPKAVAPTQDQIKLREQLYGLAQDVWAASYGGVLAKPATQTALPVAHERVEALEAALELAQKQPDLPPGLKACIDKMLEQVRTAKNSQSAQLSVSDIDDLALQLRYLDDFPAVKPGEIYDDELAALIRVQVKALKRLKRPRLVDPQQNNGHALPSEEQQVANCLQDLKDSWIRASTASSVKYSELDENMQQLIDWVASMLSWNANNGSPLTIDAAIGELEKFLL